MTIIKKISEMIEDELHVSEEYVLYALKYKTDNPSLAKSFYDLSLQEMNHVEILHNEVVKLISQHQKEHGDTPVAMQAVYDYVHEREIKKANEIKMYQTQFRS